MAKQANMAKQGIDEKLENVTTELNNVMAGVESFIIKNERRQEIGGQGGLKDKDFNELRAKCKATLDESVKLLEEANNAMKKFKKTKTDNGEEVDYTNYWVMSHL